MRCNYLILLDFNGGSHIILGDVDFLAMNNYGLYEMRILTNPECYFQTAINWRNVVIRAWVKNSTWLNLSVLGSHNTTSYLRAIYLATFYHWRQNIAKAEYG